MNKIQTNGQKGVPRRAGRGRMRVGRIDIPLLKFRSLRLGGFTSELSAVGGEINPTRIRLWKCLWST